jgi:hypothetical protein
MYEFFAGIRKDLRVCRYSDTMVEALARYARALDERELDAAFLKLWGVLELLASPDRKGSYDKIIRRVRYLYQRRDYHGQVLEHLRDYRNGMVHHDVNSEAAETYVCQLKQYVEALMDFHLWNRYGFKSLQEACQFLELSDNVGDLERQIKLREIALRRMKAVSP